MIRSRSFAAGTPAAFGFNNRKGGIEMKEIAFPWYVRDIIDTLCRAGHEAYAVGGCIRDILLGYEPKDWDITTSAMPDEVIAGLSSQGFDVRVGTGLKHGTVTVICKRKGESSYACEVTTYRSDGDYSDSRRPDSVKFVRSLREDLARRDFTVNAMASNGREIVDPFDGRKDLRAGLIRCVGEARKRFTEDSLRILRALRFAARYGFTIEPESADSMRELCQRVGLVSAERIGAELSEIFSSRYCADILIQYGDVVSGAVGVGISDPSLLRGCEDPFTRFLLFFGDNAPAVCSRLKLSCAWATRTQKALASRNDPCPREKSQVKRFMNKYGDDHAIFLKYCGIIKREQTCYDDAVRIAKEVISLGEAYTVSGLSINGDDLIKLGFSGREIGAELERLLFLVIDGRVQNERNALLSSCSSKEGRNVLG